MVKLKALRFEFLNYFCFDPAVKILLPPGGYGCLMHHVLPGSPASRVMEAAKVFSGGPGGPTWFLIDCELQVAEVLLEIARNHCPTAVDRLEAAVKELRYRSSKD